MNTRVDTLVVGSGIAGLFTALCAAEHGSVALVTKSVLQESNTRYAQGGIAAVLFEDDDIESHIADTVAAGAGLCNEAAVRVLCQDGPARVRELIALGVEFDRNENGLQRGLEGAHSRARVLHAGGDATGAAIEAALASALTDLGVCVFENSTLTDLIVEDDRCLGGHFTRFDKPFDIGARSTVLATGGAGQVYEHTTNPSVATGDGFAAAFRAGAVVRDAEMYQFHPTALAAPGDPFLVSEAVRGEGAVLRNERGERFMVDEHEMADLAPRDVVARAIASQMAAQEGRPVVLDATALGADFLRERFPSIDKRCKELGIDWSTTPVPVTPAAHYWMGGIATDLDGRTSIAGLYAAGEVASTGVHGANRLASNSLLEGVVFGARAAAACKPFRTTTPPKFDATQVTFDAVDASECSQADIRHMMWEHAGLIRDQEGLRVAQKQLHNWKSSDPTTANLLVVARLIVEGALERKESRGAHYRADLPWLSTEARHISWVSR